MVSAASPGWLSALTTLSLMAHLLLFSLLLVSLIGVAWQQVNWNT